MIQKKRFPGAIGLGTIVVATLGVDPKNKFDGEVFAQEVKKRLR